MPSLPADQGASNGTALLDPLYGVLNASVDIWSKWQTAKTDNLAAKAAIPSAAVQPVVAKTFDTKTLLLIGGGVAVVGLVLVLVLRRPGKG